MTKQHDWHLTGQCWHRLSPETRPRGGVAVVKIAGWGSYAPAHGVGVPGMKFHDVGAGGGVMAGYHHHNLMDMYPGPAINTMDWKNTSQVSQNFE